MSEESSKQMVKQTPREMTIGRLQELRIEHERELEIQKKESEVRKLEKPLREAEGDLKKVFFPLASRVLNLPESKLRSLKSDEIIEVGKMLFERKKRWMIFDKLMMPVWIGSSAVSGIAVFFAANWTFSGFLLSIFVAFLVFILFGIVFEPMSKLPGWRYADSYSLLKDHKGEDYLNKVLLDHRK